MKDAMEILAERDPRYAAEAYEFMSSAIETASEYCREGDAKKHLTASELYIGACIYALSEYGPMAREVLHFWGIATALDFGEVVYNLVNAGIFGKTEDDNIRDFDSLPPLHNILDYPYVSGMEAPGLPPQYIKIMLEKALS